VIRPNVVFQIDYGEIKLLKTSYDVIVISSQKIVTDLNLAPSPIKISRYVSGYNFTLGVKTNNIYEPG